TGAVLPPAVPVGELLDAIDATAVAGDEPGDEPDDGAGEGRATARVLARHPLQPFHPRNFTPGAIAGRGPWSFDRAWLAGARELERPRHEPTPFLAAPLPARPSPAVELDALVGFLGRPVRAFLRQRLGLPVAGDRDEVQDALTIELDGLGRWQVGDRLLRARLHGVSERDAILAEIARGTLPPGVLGKPVVDALSPIVRDILRTAEARAPALTGRDPGALEPVDARVVLAGGRIVSGSVAGVAGDVLVAATFSRVSPRQRLAAWARLLILTAAWPQRALSAVTVGRASGPDDVRVASIPPLGATEAERQAVAIEQLTLLLDLYDRGMREPLPLACMSSFAYAEAALAGSDPVPAATAKWESGWQGNGWRQGEDAEAEHVLALGGPVPFAQLAAAAPRADEHGDGWPATETSRFGRLAVRLWRELLAREEIWSR
ncbi:MAG: exodeoxyribonuclease V subunit gamma, partial [Solirubrobacteraceae bacterium]